MSFTKGYDSLAQLLSETTLKPVMLLYIYDDDFWGYYFYDKGEALDTFTPIPDYFEDNYSENNCAENGCAKDDCMEEASKKAQQETSGKSSLIAS